MKLEKLVKFWRMKSREGVSIEQHMAGNGWATVRYVGIPLDKFWSSWFWLCTVHTNTTHSTFRNASHYTCMYGDSRNRTPAARLLRAGTCSKSEKKAGMHVCSYAHFFFFFFFEFWHFSNYCMEPQFGRDSILNHDYASSPHVLLHIQAQCVGKHSHPMLGICWLPYVSASTGDTARHLLKHRSGGSGGQTLPFINKTRNALDAGIDS